MTSTEQGPVDDVLRLRFQAVRRGCEFSRALGDERCYHGNGSADGRLGDAERRADFCLGAIVAHIGQGGCHRFEKPDAWRPAWGARPAFHGVNADAEVDDFFAVEPGGIIHAMACSVD